MGCRELSRPHRPPSRSGLEHPGGQGGATMNEMKDIHRQAMRLVDEAERLRRQGDPEGARALVRQAFEHERRAAERSAADPSPEPTRSLLHRSAAALALECGEYREAERLIAAAL